MRVWTVHVLQGRDSGLDGHDPVLVREGFAWLALLFPFLWFLANRMWLVLVLYLALGAAFGAVADRLPEPLAASAALAVHVLIGFHARDLRRWTLARRGWVMIGVVAAPDGEDSALARLYARRPDLTSWGSARA